MPRQMTRCQDFRMAMPMAMAYRMPPCFSHAASAFSVRAPLAWSCSFASNSPMSMQMAVSNSHSTERLELWGTLAASVDTASGADPRDGVESYRPESYEVLVNDAVGATCFALDAGENRLEVEFPPLPTDVSSYKGSSDDFIDANIQLALAFARKLNAARGIVSKIVFPDNPEKRRASRVFQSAFDLTTGISIGCLDDVPGGTSKGFFRAIRSAFELDFEEDVSGKWESASPCSMYIIVNCSTNELPNVQKYVDTIVGNASVVLFNLELDTLRSNLGLFGFPNKDLHYDFLSQFLPAFYIRTRDYSKNVPFAPFLINYSGALFRRYPGPWQVLIKQTNRVYACVAEDRRRFTLGQTKEELLRSLGLQEQEGSTLQFLRRGYKTSTWWEEDVALEKSSSWRS